MFRLLLCLTIVTSLLGSSILCYDRQEDVSTHPCTVGVFVDGSLHLTRECPDIEYSHPNGKPLLLDASIPDGKGPFPAAILVHGGFFTEGDKTSYMAPLKRLLSGSGYAWFSVDYRLAPQFPYPAAVEDLVSAVHWVRLHAEQYSVDVNRIVLIGESAGGYLVSRFGAEGRQVSGVAAVVNFYGLSDLMIIPKHWPKPPAGVSEFFGVTDYSESSLKTLHDASPVNLITKNMPPFLFIHGTADQTVPFESSPLMCDAMKKVGNQCEVIRVEGADHAMTTWEGRSEWTSWKPLMIDWLNRTLKVAARN